MNRSPELGIIAAEPRRHLTTTTADIELLPRQSYEVSYKTTKCVAGFAFEAQHGEHAFDSSRRHTFSTQTNSLAFLPCGCEVYSYSASGGEYLRVSLSESIFKKNTSIKRFNNTTSPQATDAARCLRYMLMSNFHEPLAIEYEVMRIIESIQEVSAPRKRTDKLSSWITKPRESYIEEFIEEHLDQPLSVSDLAAKFGVSTGFFARSFKKAKGVSPHDYIIDRRVARARYAIISTSKNLTEVSLAFGFSSHAHMSMVFRKRLGVTPQSLRRSANQALYHGCITKT